MARSEHNHHVLPLFCDDLIASTVDMTPTCFGGYLRILCYAWTRGGVPNDEAACCRIAGGIELCDWSAIRLRLVLLDSGTPNERLSHVRLELERQKVAELKAKKSKAGKKGNRKRWEKTGSDEASHSDRKPIANASHSDRKTIAPTPTPTPTQEINTHTHTQGEPSARRPGPEASEPWGRAGWADDLWRDFSAAWNATERAEPWRHLTAPEGWTDLAATPGWMDRAKQALAMLPSRRYFQRPLPVTRFFEYVDRIRAGEFAEQHTPRATAGVARTQRRGNL